jgi:hypothetical protein
MREVAEAMELANARPDVRVQPEEYLRLLGYPRDWELEGRARELADWAEDWYAKNGRPWVYARQAEQFSIGGGEPRDDGFEGDAIQIDGVAFASKRLKSTLQQAEAHNVILVAVGAGPEAEEEGRRRWEQEKPDEYFFLEVFASAVVEHLVTATGAHLCDWAEQQGMAVLPHYSPGYAEWDVGEQPRLLELMKQTRKEAFPSRVDVFDSGMLRPKKTLLAVFGLTRQVERLQRLTDLVPCENCSFGPCQYRRAPYRRARRSWGEELTKPFVALDRDAKYSVNRRALQRWAEERLSMSMQADGSLDATFRYEGTTCTNMGRPLAFDYGVKLGPREHGYPILEQRCVPAEGDTGHAQMCQYLENPERLMAAIRLEKPMSGEQLNSVLGWQRKPSVAGCYCEPASRDHKWGLVFDTIHYALAQKETRQDTENS